MNQQYKNTLVLFFDLVCILFIVVLMFAAGRLLMFFVNSGAFAKFDSIDIAKSLFSGLLYDSQIVLLINSVFILLFLWTSEYYNNILYLSFLKIYYVVVNSVALLLNLIDIKYFATFNKRIDYGCINNEIHNLFEHYENFDFQKIAGEFWIVFFSWILMLALLSYALWFIKPRTKEWGFTKYVHKSFGLVMILIIIGLSFLSVSDSKTWLEKVYLRTDRQLTPLMLNNPYLVLQTSGNGYLENDVAWYFEEYNAKKQYDASELNENNLIRIIILETANSDGLSSPININDSAHAYFNLNMLMDEKASVFHYLDEILIGIPSILRTDLYQSVYSLNKINSLPQVLSRYDYHSSIVGYGIPEQTLKLIKNFYSFNHSEMITTLENRKSNQKGQFNNNKSFELYIFQVNPGENEIIQKYINDNFFKDLDAELIKNPLSIILKLPGNTGDFPKVETSMLFASSLKYNDIIKHGLITQPLDLMPSILNYINFKEPFLSYGSSIFSNEDRTIFLSDNNSNYKILKDSLLLEYKKDRTTSLRIMRQLKFSDYDYKDSLVVEKTYLENRIQSILNDLRQRLYNNQLK